MEPKYSAEFDQRMHQDIYVRMIHAGMLLITTWEFLQGNLFTTSNWYWLLLIPAIMYNIAPYISKKFIPLTRSDISIYLHLVLLGLMMILFIPVNHPLEIMAYAFLAVAAYWMGKSGAILSYSIIAVCFTIALFFQLEPSSDDVYLLILKLLLAGGLGGFIFRFSYIDRRRRSSLAEESSAVEYERIRLQSLINSMADAVIAFDTSGNIQLYNGAALILLNTNETLNDRQLSEFITFIDAEENSVDLLGEAMSDLRIIKRSDLRFINNEGERVNLYVDLAPIRLQGSTVDGFIMLLRDITREKSIEEQRDDFISIVSHELRTPIAIAEGNISTAMLPSITDPEKQHKLMSQAHKNVVFLASLVNDITTLAMVQRGDLAIEKTSVKPTDLARELYDNYKQNVEDQKLELKLDVKDVPDVQTSENRLREILQDFVTNAIKYTTEGSITIKVRENDDGKSVRFSVIDTGIGISTTDRQKVFEKFYRSENYQTREHKGTGLGLYIASKLAELIGVQIGLVSHLGKGSEFYVDVPIN